MTGDSRDVNQALPTDILTAAYFLTKRGNKFHEDEKYITIIAKNILTTYDTLQNLLDSRAPDQGRFISIEEISGCVSNHYVWDALQQSKKKSNTKPFCIINTLKPNCSLVKVIKLKVSVNGGPNTTQ